MGILDSNKILGKEIFNAYNSVNLSGSVGVVDSLPQIDCRGYNYLVLNVRSYGPATMLSIRKSVSDRDFIPAKMIFIYSSTTAKNCKKRVDGISEAGRYLIDVSDALAIQFYRNETISSGNITLDIARLSTPIDIVPKIMQLATAIVTCSSTGIAVPITRVDISKFRFFVVRIKTVPQSGESSTVRANANVQIQYRFNGAEYTAYNSMWMEIFEIENAYVGASDWIMPKSDLIDVGVVCPDASESTPKSFELTVIGIR